jgi:hypothetical protein
LTVDHTFPRPRETFRINSPADAKAQLFARFARIAVQENVCLELRDWIDIFNVVHVWFPEGRKTHKTHKKTFCASLWLTLSG